MDFWNNLYLMDYDVRLNQHQQKENFFTIENQVKWLQMCRVVLKDLVPSHGLTVRVRHLVGQDDERFWIATYIRGESSMSNTSFPRLAVGQMEGGNPPIRNIIEIPVSLRQFEETTYREKYIRWWSNNRRYRSIQLEPLSRFQNDFLRILGFLFPGVFLVRYYEFFQPACALRRSIVLDDPSGEKLHQLLEDDKGSSNRDNDALVQTITSIKCGNDVPSLTELCKATILMTIERTRQKVKVTNHHSPPLYVPPHRRKRNDDASTASTASSSSSLSSEKQPLTSKPFSLQTEDFLSIRTV